MEAIIYCKQDGNNNNIANNMHTHSNNIARTQQNSKNLHNKHGNNVALASPLFLFTPRKKPVLHTTPCDSAVSARCDAKPAQAARYMSSNMVIASPPLAEVRVHRLRAAAEAHVDTNAMPISADPHQPTLGHATRNHLLQR